MSTWTPATIVGDACPRIGADIGGTFTDIAFTDAVGNLRIGKQLTSHGTEGDAIIDALHDAGVPLHLERMVMAHGHTLVINALLERNGANTALVTTRGFADVLDIGRASRPETFNLRYRRDPPLIPRAARFEIAERVDANGAVVEAPDDGELASVVDTLRRRRTEAVAVALLNSYIQPANERYVRDFIERALPSVTVTVSSELSRQWREFERFATAAANAYVAPVSDRYCSQLLARLHAGGFRGNFLVVDSNGGALTLGTASRYPVRTVESGPVAGVLAARMLAEELAVENMVTFDMGGTTAKSCLVESGRFALTDLYWIGGYERGFPLQVNSVDVTEVGAGGGSIAWVDDSGRLRVGPRSAGSRPGPACYGLGGTQPTVTDANVCAGRLDKDNFVGSLRLDVEAAASALAKLGGELGVQSTRLALGVIRLANLSMAAAVRRQTIERGRDPRDLVLVAYGGAGPMHACEVAAAVGIERVVVPEFPGHFSAIGMLGANLRLDRREAFPGLLDHIDREALGAAVKASARELAETLREGRELSSSPPSYSYSLALRYRGQDHTLVIPARTPGLKVAADFASIFAADFEREYQQRYGHNDPQAEVELVELQVVVEHAIATSPTNHRQRSSTGGESKEIQTYFGPGDDPVTSLVVSRASLKPGDLLVGPMIIYEDGATTVVPPFVTGEVSSGGQLILDLSNVEG